MLLYKLVRLFTYCKWILHWDETCQTSERVLQERSFCKTSMPQYASMDYNIYVFILCGQINVNVLLGTGTEWLKVGASYSLLETFTHWLMNGTKAWGMNHLYLT